VENTLRRTHERFAKSIYFAVRVRRQFSGAGHRNVANGLKAVIDIDLLGTFNICRVAFLGKPGASLLGISASHVTTPVGCAGARLCGQGRRRAAHEDVGTGGIRANCITPGPTNDTEGMGRLAPTAEARLRIAHSVPLRRYGTKDELTDLALFLCTDASPAPSTAARAAFRSRGQRP
jgi:NAD(P)-dependent dehydrogenase (short-subunit alcohol dehydrogenase family)